MTRQVGSSRRQKSRGQAMVEFALIAPVFFLLVFGIIELGLLFGGQNGLVASTRELARYAAPFRVKTAIDANNVCADTRLSKQLTQFLKDSVPGYVAANVGTRQVTYSWIANPIATSGLQTYSVQLTVHVSYHFPLHVPLVGAVLDDHLLLTPSKQLDATETMRIENEDLPAADYSAVPVTCTI
jgi:Flp pilus assembly protein TadG